MKWHMINPGMQGPIAIGCHIQKVITMTLTHTLAVCDILHVSDFHQLAQLLYQVLLQNRGDMQEASATVCPNS